MSPYLVLLPCLCLLTPTLAIRCYEGTTADLPGTTCADEDACFSQYYRTTRTADASFNRFCVDAAHCRKRALYNRCLTGKQILDFFYQTFLKQITDSDKALRKNDTVIESLFCCCDVYDLCNHQQLEWLRFERPPPNMTINQTKVVPTNSVARSTTTVTAAANILVLLCSTVIVYLSLKTTFASERRLLT